jgi:hypothetical protein
MNVVLHAAYDDGLAIKLGQNPANVAMQLLAQRGVAQEGARSLVENTE